MVRPDFNLAGAGSAWRTVRTLPYALGLRSFVAPRMLWSKGVGDYCDFAGTRAYRLAPTEATQPESFFAEHYRAAHGLVWLRLGTIPRDVDKFVQVALPQIRKPFILITTDGDAAVPSGLRPDTVTALKASPYLVAWYSQNCDGTSAAVRPFPIGLDFHTLRNWTTPQRLASSLARVRRAAAPVRMRQRRLFSDLNLSPTPARREAIAALQGCDHFDQAKARLSQTAIWRQYARYPLVLSAEGNGMDCHRTWELLLLGCIVVTKTSSLDGLYEGLPVTIVEDWREARDPARLCSWIERLAPLTDAEYIRERLNPEYWTGALRAELARAAPCGTCKPD